MWPYFALVVLILFLQIKVNSQITKMQFYIGILILFVFAACRGNGSGDYFVYLNYGWDIRTFQEALYTHKNMEIGYRLIALFTNYLGLPGQANIIAMNFISITCISIFIKKYSKDWCLSLLVFLPLFFQFDMHAARTAVAISVSAFSLKYVIEKKPVKFIFVVVLAMMFHSSAVAALPLFILPYMKFDLVTGLLLIGVDIVFAALVGIDSLVFALLDLLGLEQLRAKYWYTAVYNAETYGYRFSLWDPRLLILIAVFVIAAVTMKKRGKLENILINCCLANILILILFSEHTLIACRLSSFYNIYIVLLVPSIMNHVFELFNQYKSRYTGLKNRVLSRAGCIAFYGLLACVYIYVCFIAIGVDYRVFFK